MDKKIKLIIGLGNPDSRYKQTYHNVGFLFVDYLIKNIPKLEIIKSDVYMNDSGSFVAKKLKKSGLKSEALLIVHDDSDIALGNYKFSFGRGAAGHKGVESIIANLKTRNFWRLRIGIRPKEEKIRQKAERFVLKKISSADSKILEETFERAVAGLNQASAKNS